jgi:CHAT domain-containing protein
MNQGGGQEADRSFAAVLAESARCGDDSALQALDRIHRQSPGAIGVELVDELRALSRQWLGRDIPYARRLADVAIRAAEWVPSPNTLALASAAWAVGNACYMANEPVAAIDAYRAAIAGFDSAEAHDPAQQVMGNLVGALMEAGRLDEAEQAGHLLLDKLKGQAPASGASFNLRLNLGTLANQRGDCAVALDHLCEAERIAVGLDDRHKRAQALVNQAIALEKLDQLARADMALETACALLTAEGETADEGRAWLNRAILDYRQGRWQAALDKFNHAEACYESAKDDTERPTVWHYRARCYLALNLTRDALQAAENAAAAWTARQMPREVAYANAVIGEVNLHLGRDEPASLAFDRALRLFEADGDAVEAALIRMQRSVLLLRARQPDRALAELDDVMRALTPGEHPLRHAQAQIERARCCLDLGDVLEAKRAYTLAWQVGRRDGSRPPGYLAYQIRYGHGVVAEAAGRRATARRSYECALDIATALNEQLELPDLRSGWMDAKRPAFEAAMRLALEDGDIAGAFRVSESARATAWRALTCEITHAGNLTGVPVEAALRRRTEQLRARWHALVSASAHSGQRASPEALVEVERELADAYRANWPTDSAGCAGATTPANREPYSLASVMARLGDDQALLVFDVLGDELIAFVVTAGQATVARRLASVRALRREAIGLNHACEEATLFRPERQAALIDGIQHLIQPLGQSLIGRPLAALRAVPGRLWLVPSAAMAMLPIQMLADAVAARPGDGGAQPSVQLCPSASWAGERPIAGALSVDGRHSLVVGHSFDGRLPRAVDEARAVADVLAGEWLIEQAATPGALAAAAPTADILHIAAHGAFRPDNPMFSSIHLAGGAMTAYDVLRLLLPRRPLVTLSACQTGLASLRGGEVLGLAGSFLQAGASALIVSQWRVDDAATAVLMKALYAHLLQGEPVAAALRSAQAETRQRYPHPFYWAGFNVWQRIEHSPR